MSSIDNSINYKTVENLVDSCVDQSNKGETPILPDNSNGKIANLVISAFRQKSIGYTPVFPNNDMGVNARDFYVKLNARIQVAQAKEVAQVVEVARAVQGLLGLCNPAC